MPGIEIVRTFFQDLIVLGLGIGKITGRMELLCPRKQDMDVRYLLGIWRRAEKSLPCCAHVTISFRRGYWTQGTIAGVSCVVCSEQLLKSENKALISF
jgi:ribosome modulation factor